MPPRLTECKRCGKSIDECGALSTRGICIPCGEAAMIRQATAMKNGDPETWNNWRRKMAASVGAVLIEDIADGTYPTTSLNEGRGPVNGD